MVHLSVIKKWYVLRQTGKRSVWSRDIFRMQTLSQFNVQLQKSQWYIEDCRAGYQHSGDGKDGEPNQAKILRRQNDKKIPAIYQKAG